MAAIRRWPRLCRWAAALRAPAAWSDQTAATPPAADGAVSIRTDGRGRPGGSGASTRMAPQTSAGSGSVRGDAAVLSLTRWADDEQERNFHEPERQPEPCRVAG